MKLPLYLLPLVFAACQSAPPGMAVGDAEWMAWAEQKAGVTDGHGHGPDHGSAEWCDALHYRVYGERAVGGAPCDQAWMKQIDAELRKK